jgi:ketosteroid isomerase-like protein
LLLVSSLAFALVAGTAFAASPATKGTNTQAQDAQQLSPAAKEAVEVVNGFMASLVAGKLDAARQYMTPDAVVMANGNVLGNRDGYINGAAKADAAALAQVQRELLRRDVKAGNNFGWVLSEKRIAPMGAAQGAPSEVVTETMLLARTDAGWKITHIHWSGRHAR